MRHQMCNRILIGTLLLVVTSIRELEAQPDSTGKDNLLSEGTWSLQFGVSGYLTLTSFKGTIVSAKYHLSPTSAIRVSISGDLSHNSDAAGVADPSINDRESFQVTLAYLLYSKVHEHVYFFWGGGPLVGLDRTYEERPLSGQDFKTVTTRAYPRWSMGGSVVAGVEWFATTWLSLHSEYGVSATYSWMRSTTILSRVSTNPSYPSVYDESYTTSKSWYVRPTGVSFGASIYL
jgi:hypothetical protein